MSAQLLTMRLRALSLILTPVLLAIALWPVLGVGSDPATPGQPTATSAPPLWAVLVPLAVGVLCLVLISTAGYRTPALEPGTPPEDGVHTGLGVLRTGQVLRFAVAEVPALVGVTLAFVVDGGGYLAFLVGAAITLVLGVLHVWPSDAQVTRVQEQLESAGARAPLLDTLHGQPTY